MGLEFNFGKLIETFDKIDDKVQNNIIKKSLEKSAEPTKEELKRVINEEARDTGDLYRSIDISSIKKSGTAKMIYVGSTTDDESIRVRLYYNEYGNNKMVGKKLLKRTAKKTKGTSIDVITETIKKELDKL